MRILFCISDSDMTNFFDKLTSLSFALLFLFVFLWAFLVKPPERVYEERRASRALSSVTAEGFLDGSFVASLEGYLSDATPCRSLFYRLHTAVFSGIFRNPECHGVRRGSAGLEKVMPSLDEALIDHNLSVLADYRAYFGEGSRAFSVLIPDKSVYTKDDGDYNRAARLLSSDIAFDFVECRDTLTVDDYFYGDIHIRPECYGALSKKLSEKMGFSVTRGLTASEGVTTKGTLALQYPCEIYDTFSRLEDADGILDRLVITAPSGALSLYADSGELFDPYDLYLGGEVGNGIVTVQNPDAKSAKRLIVFRDSFARAFVPYLAADYDEIVLVDLRAPKWAILSVLSEYGALSSDILLFVSTHTLFTTRF